MRVSYARSRGYTARAGNGVAVALVMHLDGTLGKAIRSERTKRRLTVEALAAHAGVSRRHLSAIEAGANVSVFLVLRVAAVLGLKEVDLGGVTGKVNLTAIPAAVPEVEKVLRDLDDIEKWVARARSRLQPYAAPGRRRRGKQR